MAISHPHNDITDFAGHRQNVKVYADLESGQVIFEGQQVNIDPMPLSALVASEAVSGANNPRVKIARADITTGNGDQWVLMKRRPAWRFYDKNEVRITSGTDGPTQITQILTYLNAEFNKSVSGAVAASADVEYDVYADPTYTGGDSDGTSMKPWLTIQDAVDNASSGDQIYLKGDFAISSVVNLPADKDLHFFGNDKTQWCYPSYDSSNGMLAYQSSSSCTSKFTFNHIRFINAGSYGLYIRSALEVNIVNCEFKRCGWDGTRLSTTAAGTDTWANGGTLGYDSAQADLQAFWASTHTSNGGAMRIRSTPVVNLTDSVLHTNLRGARIQDCGIGGAGVISRNRCYNNIESGIYLAAGGYGYSAVTGDGCENFTVYNNYCANNSNNGILVIGGSNNIVSLNRVEGNWNAGVMLWNVSDTRARDMDLNNNNRSEFNGIGNSGDAGASIQISGPGMRADATFLAEVLDTTVHNTGLGNATTKNGLKISSNLPAAHANGLPTGRPLVNIDDVAFVNQDYGIVCDDNADDLRLTISDCRYTNMGEANVLVPTGSFNELPFSNLHVDAASLDFSLDSTESRVNVKENGKVIQSYGINDLQAIGFGTYIRILVRGSNRIQWDSLNVATTKINGTLVNGVLATAVNELNGLFTKTSPFGSGSGNPVVSGTVSGDTLTLLLTDNTSVAIDVTTLNVDTNNSVASGELVGTNLVLTMSDASTVSVDIQTLVVGTNPTYPADNWYVAFGSSADTLLPNNKFNNTYKNHMPMYYGDTLEKGKEFVWSYDGAGTLGIGIWDGATNGPTGTNAHDNSNWSMRFAIEGDATGGGSMLVRHSNTGTATDTVGTDIDSRYASGYQLAIGDTLAIRYMDNDKLGLFKLTDGANVLIAESNDTYSGPVTFHAHGQTNAAQSIAPYWSKREDVYEFAHRGTVNNDGTGGLDTDWRDGTEQRTILKTIQTFGPGQKMRFNIDFTGTNHRFGLGYTGAATGETDPVQFITDKFRYGAHENFYQMPDWTLNTEAVGYRSIALGNTYDGYQVANGVPMGEVEIRYVDANTIRLWSVENQETIATLDRDPAGLDQRVYFGRIQYDTTIAHLPIITRMDMTPAVIPDLKPDMSDQDVMATEGSFVNYVIQKDNDSDAVTMYGAEGLPSWLVLNQLTGVLMGTAPAWTGTPGSGLTNDTVVTMKAANPFGISTFTLTVKVGEIGQSTNWTKAYEFDSTSDYVKQDGNSDNNNPLRKNLSLGSPQPWSVATVFYYDGEASNNTLWAQAEGAGGSNKAIKLQIPQTHKLWFRTGTDAFNDHAFTSTDNVPTDTWMGVVVTYDGGALDSTTLGNAGETAADRFKIQYVDLSTGAVTDVAGTWVESGTGNNAGINGDFTMGALYSHTHVWDGKIASCVATTNTDGYTMQDSEISDMVRDPMGWVNTYRVGNAWRVPDEGTNRTDFQIDHTATNVGGWATKIFLFGDGTNDAFPSIANQVMNNHNSMSASAFNMTSSQVVNVTIPGLS